MKIKKLLFVSLFCGFALSCSQDKIEETQTDDPRFIQVQQYDQSNLGIYKGVFTTQEGLQRGAISISLGSDKFGNAQIELSSGEVIELMSSKVNADTNVNNLHFYTNSLIYGQTSFEFSVERNGNNPAISNVIFDNKASDVMIAKETSRIPVEPITGMYICDNCATVYPDYAAGSHTFNIMTIGAGSGRAFATQVSYNGRVFNSPAILNTQTNCNDEELFTTCDLNGSGSIAGRMLNWSGTHVYVNSPNESCSDISGTWTVEFGAEDLAGTFQSDNNCSGFMVPPNDVCAGALTIACGETMTGNTTAGNTADAPSGVCEDFTLDTAPGVWFTYIGASSNNEVTVDTNGSGFDTKIGVFTGSCGALTCLVFDDDGLGLQSIVSFQETLGETYYVYVTGFSTNSGNYSLNVSCAEPLVLDLDLTCDEVMVDNGLLGSYEYNSNDTYNIDAGAGNTISLEFSAFEIEDGWDFMRIYDGVDTSATEITMSVGGNSASANGFTGTVLNGDSVVSSGQYLTVVFISDNLVNQTGFFADVVCVPSDGRHPGLQQTKLTYSPKRAEFTTRRAAVFENKKNNKF